ncbi:hypothetical protein BDQ17DRAFT_164192 [Cyathus striatus]|nr:hypothetical protein BDQ17DRAFT_164192 [Cyathus striatus]
MLLTYSILFFVSKIHSAVGYPSFVVFTLNVAVTEATIEWCSTVGAEDEIRQHLTAIYRLSSCIDDWLQNIKGVG